MNEESGKSGNLDVTTILWLLLASTLFCPMLFVMALASTNSYSSSGLHWLFVAIPALIAISRIKFAYNTHHSREGSVSLSGFVHDLTGLGLRLILVSVLLGAVEIYDTLSNSNSRGPFVYLVAVLYFFVLSAFELIVSYARSSVKVPQNT